MLLFLLFCISSSFGLSSSTLVHDGKDNRTMCYQCVYGIPGFMDEGCQNPIESHVLSAFCESDVACVTVTHRNGSDDLLLIRSCGVGNTDVCGSIGSATHQDLNLDHLGNETVQEMIRSTLSSRNCTENVPEVCYCSKDNCNDMRVNMTTMTVKGRSEILKAETSTEKSTTTKYVASKLQVSSEDNAGAGSQDDHTHDKHDHHKVSASAPELSKPTVFTGLLVMTLGLIM